MRRNAYKICRGRRRAIRVIRFERGIAQDEHRSIRRPRAAIRPAVSNDSATIPTRVALRQDEVAIWLQGERTGHDMPGATRIEARGQRVSIDRLEHIRIAKRYCSGI